MNTTPPPGHPLDFLADGLLASADGALARVWLAGPGDLCEGCAMRVDCADRTRCLHLERSAGTTSRIDGPFRRIPIGTGEVGRVARTLAPFVANKSLDVLGLADRTWLMAHDVRAFAAVPMADHGDCLGVAAVFARAPVDPRLQQTIESLAALAALALTSAGARPEAGGAMRHGEGAGARATGADAGAFHTAGGAMRHGEPGRRAARGPGAAPAHDVLPLMRAWQDIERDILERVLAHTGGRVSGPRGAAAILHLKPTTLQSRLKKLGVRKPPR
jgi:hypothetical protein